VLHHRVGLPLACYLHNGGSSVDDVRPYFPNFSAQHVLPDDHDGVFEKRFGQWIGGSEKAFTKGLAEDIGASFLASPRAWSVEHDIHVREGRTRGSVDVLVQCRRDNEQGGSAAEAPVLLVEVGLENEEWWMKLNQGYEYLSCLKNFRRPVLLAAVAFEPRGGGADQLRHRIGVFLAAPRSDRPSDPGRERKLYSTSLLWRSQGTSATALSRSFGRVLRATRLLAEWDGAESSYEYLGPNCCRIGPEVRT
jgi:hypothetical protein